MKMRHKHLKPFRSLQEAMTDGPESVCGPAQYEAIAYACTIVLKYRARLNETIVF